MYTVFMIGMTVICFGIIMVVRYKLKLKEKEIPFNRFDSPHKWGLLIFLVAILVLFAFILFSETTPPRDKSHYFFLCSTAVTGFRAFIEWKFYRHTKQYLQNIIASVCFLIVFLGAELVFLNPVPVRLGVEQVSEISVEFSESEHGPVRLTDKGSFKPIVSAVSDGTYMIGRWPVTPRLEMVITLADGGEVVIGQVGAAGEVFMVSVDRLFFPKDMIMGSPELELVFNALAGEIDR